MINYRIIFSLLIAAAFLLMVSAGCRNAGSGNQDGSLQTPPPVPVDTLRASFLSPPDAYRPCVFWDWMGGMISREGITRDLEAMAAQGIGGVMIMQMPDQFSYPERWEFRDYPGKVKVLSKEWFDLVNFAIGEADRLGMSFSMFISPGWSHAGGPWMKMEESLKKLVAHKTEVTGPGEFRQEIPRAPKVKGRGHQIPSWFTVSDSIRELANRPDFYKDLAVLAFPVTEKQQSLDYNNVVDLSAKMDNNGVLNWTIPPGNWTIMRLGVASENGENHPAAFEATGLEADRMDTAAARSVFEGMIGRIIREAREKGYRAFKAFETDSYEAGFQDFGVDFRDEFKKRRGYDCVNWLPAWLDRNMVINDEGQTQRFRYDMQQTISELTAERFHGKLRSLAGEYQVDWMTEPYFMLPLDWITLGSKSTMPGCEFWVEAGFAVMGPAPDIAALYGVPVVWAESFTAGPYNSAWKYHPQLLKPWGDAAFCRGINQFYMHGFTHNPFGDEVQPGFTMSFWGTQLNRYVTWWPYSRPWHQYLTRCQYLLRQGNPVNDLLVYPSKMEPVTMNVVDAGPFRQVVLNDDALMNRLSVKKDGRIAVKGGGEFATLVLTPDRDLQPEALQHIRELVQQGATLIGNRPRPQSPSLKNYPSCDREISGLINELWGPEDQGASYERTIGKGKLIVSADLPATLSHLAGGPDVQFYGITGKGNIRLSGYKEQQFTIFSPSNLKIPSLQTNANTSDELNTLDFMHRRTNDADIYFIANTGTDSVETMADFRVSGRVPELWDPLTGEQFDITGWKERDGRIQVPVQFAPEQSFFVVFRNKDKAATNTALPPQPVSPGSNLLDLSTDWEVSFDPRWGGPGTKKFPALEDWTKQTEKGIRHYSGTAVYRKKFDGKEIKSNGAASDLYLELGKVNNLAEVTLNDKNLGVVWSAPWHIKLPASLIRDTGNLLTIKVVNTWVNRIIGDEQEPEDAELVSYNRDDTPAGFDMRALKELPSWITDNKPRPSGKRYTFTSWRYYRKDAPLHPAGLQGPVRITEKTLPD